MRIFTVFDTKAAIYGQPFYAVTDGIALRMFSDAVNNNSPDNALNRYPEDFTLYYIGEFDDVTGSVTGNLTPMLVANGTVVKQ